jgi:hypothetical protein
MRLFLTIILGIVFLGVLGLEKTQATGTLLLNALLLAGMGGLLSYADLRKIILIHRSPTCAINALPAAGRVGITGKTQIPLLTTLYSRAVGRAVLALLLGGSVNLALFYGWFGQFLGK